jgi:HEAT repeat protein
LRATFRSQHRKTEHKLRDFVHKAAEVVPEFSEAFVQIFNTKLSAFTGSFASAHFIVLRMTCAIIEVVHTTSEKGKLPKWFDDFLIGQCVLLESSLNDPLRFQKVAQKELLTFLKENPDLISDYTAIITEKSFQRSDAFYVLWLVLCETGALDTQTCEKLLKAYVYWAFDSKTRSTVKFMNKDPRLHGLTYEQFDAIIKPSIARMLKKAPDSVLEATTYFIRAVPLDFERYLQELFLTVITTKLRSQKEDVRTMCMQLVKELLGCFKNPKGIKNLVTEVGGLLDGKFGILAQFYMREAAFASLLEGARASKTNLNSDDSQELALSVLPVLIKGIDKEAHDNTRHLGLLALGEWLSLTSSIPSDVIAKVKAGLGNKNDAVVAGYLRALAKAANSKQAASIAKGGTNLVDDLLNIVLESNKKPNVLHLDGVLAISILAAFAVSSSAIDAKLNQANIPQLLAEDASVSNSYVESSIKSLLGSSAAVDDQAIGESLEQTALQVISPALAWSLASFTGEAESVPIGGYKLLIELLCSTVHSARKSAEEAVKNLYASSFIHCEGLINAFEKKISNLSTVQATKVIHTSDEEITSHHTLTSSVLRRALRVVLPTDVYKSQETVESTFALVLYLSHHPLLIEGGQDQQLFSHEWKSLKQRFLSPVDNDESKSVEQAAETVCDRIDNLIEAHEFIRQSIIDLLTKEEVGKLFSSKRKERLAGQRVIATLLIFAGNGEGENIALQEILQDALMKQIDGLEVGKITPLDVAIFDTPFDEIYDPKKVEKEQSEASTRKRGIGRQRGNEDEQWEAQIREELEKKKQAAGVVEKKLTPEEKAILANQQAIRTTLQASLDYSSIIVETLETVARFQPDEMHPAIPYLLRSLTSLFSCYEIFEGVASASLVALAKCLRPEYIREEVASEVASALTTVLEIQVKQEKEELSFVTVQNLLLTHEARLRSSLVRFTEYAFGYELDQENDYDGDGTITFVAPPTFHLLFPIIKYLIIYVPSLRHFALPLFAAHARMIPEEEEEDIGDVAAHRLLRKEMIELALEVLYLVSKEETLPIENPDLKPSRILTKVCLGASLSIGEWTPLLGNKGLLSHFTEVRHACLAAILEIAESDESELRTKANPLLACRLFCSCFDSDTSNQEIARKIWQLTDSKLTKLFAAPLLVLLNHLHSNVRESAALAITDGMAQFRETIPAVINNLKAQFTSHAPKAIDDVDEFGIPKVCRPGDKEVEDLEEPQGYLPRCGVGLCMEKMSSLNDKFTTDHVLDIMSFVVESGLADPNSHVRSQMRKTGVVFLTACGGGANTALLLNMLEKLMDKKPPSDKSDKKALVVYDHQREGLVVFLGALAKHLDKNDPKVSKIVDALVEALSIPSESVQRSVATCLAPLIPAVKDKSIDLLHSLLNKATSGETFGDRIGAAFGVSAVIKGLGISALKQQEVISKLEESMKKGGANARQGALLVFECMCERLGMLFEPYIIVILPILLKCFADSSTQVRDTATQTSKGIMGNLSAHGVKLILPSLLTSLEDNAWRTKQAGIQLLGSMAYCAPRQLGSCLPQVVPKLTSALTDSHPKVRDAAKSSLRDIGSVVRNPEVKTIANALLNALEDPNKNTNEALLKLQSTHFVHAIDAPSLALVMPIITRGLRDRAGDAKKKSALIVGSMCSMINDAKDLIPYMDMVLPSLKIQLMDPIPEVRAVSAKAVGKLVKGIGEKHFIEIFNWLLEAIKGEEYGSVERSGAAQGLCEVLVSLGKDRVEKTMFDEIFPLARHPKNSVREGVLWVIAFLPPALGKSFAVFLPEALPTIVAGLSDEAESVREVAMHSGHVVVNAHALSHTKDILPALEDGLFDDNWRIRQSSVALLGDLMYRISGTRAVGVTEENVDEVDGNFGGDDDDLSIGSAHGDKAIIRILGIERRNAILASLYMIRSDTSAVVRQSALQVWKSVVMNTPKTLKQILETLMRVIVSALSGNNLEKQTMAGRTLGEIVRKLGDNVMPEIIPILRAGLNGKNPPGTRQGACIGLSEIIDCSTKKQLEDYVDTLVQAVLDGLCDEMPEVRSAAAQAFDVLQKGIGYRSIDETVPALLERIKSPNENVQRQALFGLQEMLRVKSKEVLPYLIPRLLAKPLSIPTVEAIASVAEVTGSVIHFQIEKIFSTMFSEYVEMERVNPILAVSIKTSLSEVVRAVETAGVHWLAIELCKYCESEQALQRALAFHLIGEFGSHATIPYHEQTPLFLKQIIVHLNDPVTEVVHAASDALKGINATTRPEALSVHLDFIRQTLNSVVSDARHRKGGVGVEGEFVLPGLGISKGLEPFMPSYQHALMNGSPELRASAAAGLGELVMLSSAASLRPYLIKLTGPLIRIAGDRFPGHIKAAILNTLEIILGKGGVALKPFLPQLQTTFVKALNDNALEVRRRGTSALSKLVSLSPRIDPLIAELSEKLRTTTSGIRESNLEAVTSVMESVGEKVSAGVRTGLEQSLVDLLESSEDLIRELASKCLALSVVVDDVEAGAQKVLSTSLVDEKDLASISSARKQSAAIFLTVVINKKPIWVESILPQVKQVLAVLGEDDQVSVRSCVLKAISEFVKLDPTAADTFVPLLAQGIQQNKEVAKSALKITKRIAKQDPNSMRKYLTTLVPQIFSVIKGNNIALKNTAERTLLYLLEVHTRPETVTTYTKSVDAANGKIISEYSRRVLSKLKPDSGTESD